MNRLVLTVVVMLALAAPLFGCANQTAETLKPVSLEEALGMPPSSLALIYLLNFENTRSFEQSYAGFKIIEKQIREKRGTFTYKTAVFYPDGTAQTLILKTSEDLDQYLAKARLVLTTYEQAIMKRGFKQLAPTYEAMVSPGCFDRWFTSGKVAVKQKGFMFELSQASKAVSGAVVEDTVIVKLYGTVEPDTALVGEYGKTIELRNVQLNCRIILKARS